MAMELAEQIHGLPGFDERLQNGHEPAVLRTKRDEAFAVYAATPAPMQRDEEWRRTDPALFSFDAVSRLSALEPAPSARADAWDDQFDVVVAIDDRSFSISDRTGVLRKGVCSVTSLRDAAEKTPELIAEYLQGAALPTKPRKFELLNAAFWNVGLIVHVPARTALPNGILVRYDHKASGGAIVPRLIVVAEDGSDVKVVEHFTSPDAVPFMCIGAREFYAGAGANLKLISVQEWGNATQHIGEDWASFSHRCSTWNGMMSVCWRNFQSDAACSMKIFRWSP